jgi:hypothetical protein
MGETRNPYTSFLFKPEVIVNSNKIKNTIIWGVTHCSPVEVHRRSWGMVLAGFLLCILFDPEDGSSTFFLPPSLCSAGWQGYGCCLIYDIIQAFV